MDIKDIARNLHPLERKVVPFLEISSNLKSLVETTGMKEVEVMRALQWLSNKGIIKIKEEEEDMIELGKNGRLYKNKGLPERRFLNAIKEFPLTISKIIEKAGLHPTEVNICIGTLKGKAAIDIKKDKEMIISITEPGKNILSKETFEEKFLKKEFPLNLSALKDEEKFAYENLKKRKDILELNKIKTKTIELAPSGKEFTNPRFKADWALGSASLRAVCSKCRYEAPNRTQRLLNVVRRWFKRPEKRIRVIEDFKLLSVGLFIEEG